MAGMRLTGLISGMDTESMVQELVKASSTKVDKVKQKKQLLQWKQEAWQGLNTKLYNFYKNELSIFQSASTYQKKKASVNDETKVSVSASGSALNGTHTVSVKQIASAAYLTGGNIKNSGNTYKSYLNAGTKTNFADMTDASGNSLNLSGQTIRISDDTQTLEFVLGGEGENGVANLNELNAKLEENGFKLQASISDGQITFTNGSADVNEDGELIGSKYIIDAEAFGVSGLIGYEKDTDIPQTITGETSLKYETEFTSKDITTSTKLSDLGIKVGTTFSVNGQDFVVDENTKISDFTSALSKMGVTASFDAKQGRFYINASGSGAENDFTLTANDAEALEILGLGSTATKIDAKDAIIEYNGVEYRGSTNTFNINNLTITAKAVTGEYDEVTGEFKNDVPLTITVDTDTDSIYQSIKNFVNKYNELIEEMNKLYDEKKTSYEPLTDEERSQLSETQIEQWEEKAKQGVLRRDSTISTLLSNMRNILNQSVEVTNEDGTKSRFTLASLGIVTGDYSENGKLHILGDEDDETYSMEENKLKKALEQNPDIFAKVFAGNKDNPGIGSQMYTSLNQSMRRIDGVSRSLTFYEDITIENELGDYDKEIDKWQDKLKKLEDKYYDQFAAMEAAMASMQAQQSYLSSLMGGMSS